MARVTIQDCLEHVSSRFDLTLIAAKRARQLTRGAEAKLPWDGHKSTVLALREIASCEGVQRLTFGALDFAVDLGLRAGSAGAEAMLDQLRYDMLLQSRVHDLQPPLDTVYPAFDDEEGFTAVVRRSHDMGLFGALCIHPRQVAVVRSPSDFASRPGGGSPTRRSQLPPHSARMITPSRVAPR